jgi:hypothetical protein
MPKLSPLADKVPAVDGVRYVFLSRGMVDAHLRRAPANPRPDARSALAEAAGRRVWLPAGGGAVLDTHFPLAELAPVLARFSPEAFALLARRHRLNEARLGGYWPLRYTADQFIEVDGSAGPWDDPVPPVKLQNGFWLLRRRAPW